MAMNFGFHEVESMLDSGREQQPEGFIVHVNSVHEIIL